ncbi:hypothetical protein GcC1_057027 [Golovinomyces cichoracearum]|uniref:Uncharacterized protein n=1 Tax=Golovinomyces cichoracearum TaxID=62708 RepID=A0A420IUN8_9PEZI|nr:hypothetical protein GcC1_057027 [Golovinomyces cichoracearum]
MRANDIRSIWMLNEGVSSSFDDNPTRDSNCKITT